MKTNSLLYSFFVFCVLVNISPLFGNGEEPSTISFEFQGFDSDSHKSFFDLTIENGINPRKEQLKISDLGLSSITFSNTKLTELEVNYENRKFNLFVAPGDNISIKISINELLNFSNFKSFEISGHYRRTNQLILSKTHFVDSLVNQSTGAFSTNKYSDTDYKAIRIKEMHSQLEVLNTLLVKQRIEDTLFGNWAKSKIRYTAGWNLASYPFVGKINRELSSEDEYFEFILDIEATDESSNLLSSHLEYLKTLATTYEIVANISHRFRDRREQLMKDSIGSFPILFDIIKNHQGQDQELLMALAFKTQANISESYLDSLDYYVKQPLISQIKEDILDEERDILDLLKEYEISNKEKDELIQLYKSTSGKVIFHDFWFTGCKPCIDEFESYNKLIKLIEENAVFIFFGAFMDEPEWKEAVQKYGLNGVHYLLNKDQMAFFEKYFQVFAFPHHHIVSAKGKIINTSIPSVTPPNFERIKELIQRNKDS